MKAKKIVQIKRTPAWAFKKSAWTRFMDMHSGGSLKEKQQYIYIEASMEEAKFIFYNRFSHNPDRVTCTCCGNDYSIDESPSFAQSSGYERGCLYATGYEEKPSGDGWRKYLTVTQYIAKEDVRVIRKKDIKPNERSGVMPKQGYIWAG